MQSNNVCDYCANNGNCTESAFCYISAPGFKGIEAEQIIHCKDCEHWDRDVMLSLDFVYAKEWRRCKFSPTGRTITQSVWYCPNGKRRKSEAEETRTALYMPCSTCKNKGLPCCDDCDPPFTDYWEEK